MVALSKCEVCGKEFSNLGVHMRMHKPKVDYTDYAANLIVDVPKEKPLSEIVDEVKDLLKRYRFTVKVSYEEEDVNISNIEILARFQVRR